MTTPLHFSTFETFRPHFDALQRVGYYKIVMKQLPPSRYRLHHYYMVVTFILVVLYNLQNFIKVFQNIHSIEVMVNTLFILLTTISSLGKQLAFMLRSARIERLIRTIDGPLFACTQDYHDHAMRANGRAMLRLLRFYHLSIYTCVVFFGAFPILNRVLEDKVELSAYFPFDTDTSPAFELATVYLWVLIILQAYGNGTMDCTIVSFYAQGKTQLQMLRYNFEHLLDTDGVVNIDPNVNKGNNARRDCGDDGLRALQRRFVHCVQHYGQIVWFSNEIESIFGEAMVVQFFVSAWVICMTLYKIVDLNPMSAEFISMVLYLGCMLFQLFIYCYYGTQLTMESELVNQSIYWCSWLRLPPRFRRQLLVMMERCVRRIRPRSAYIVPLSLDTFITVLRSSYTLFTVLDRSRK